MDYMKIYNTLKSKGFGVTLGIHSSDTVKVTVNKHNIILRREFSVDIPEEQIISTMEYGYQELIR